MVREDQAGILNQLLSSLDAIPEEIIALTAYGVGAIIALWCWWRLSCFCYFGDTDCFRRA